MSHSAPSKHNLMCFVHCPKRRAVLFFVGGAGIRVVAGIASHGLQTVHHQPVWVSMATLSGDSIVFVNLVGDAICGRLSRVGGAYSCARFRACRGLFPRPKLWATTSMSTVTISCDWC